MPNSRRKSPGSFRDELGGLIERVGRTAERTEPPKKKPRETRVNDPAELNKHLFERARRKVD
jgi:hypothetical protein